MKKYLLHKVEHARKRKFGPSTKFIGIAYLSAHGDAASVLGLQKSRASQPDRQTRTEPHVANDQSSGPIVRRSVAAAPAHVSELKPFRTAVALVEEGRRLRVPASLHLKIVTSLLLSPGHT